MQWQKNLYTLWMAQFVASLGLTLIAPFVPLYIGTLGVSRLDDVERWSGILFAAPFLVQAFAQPLWGVLGDRYGRKMMVLRALAGIGGTQVLSALVRNVGELLALRLMQGGVAGFVSASNALVSASIPRDRLGTAMGVLQTSLTAGGVIGPLVGGALADLVGFRYVFVITGALCFAAAGVVLWGVHEPAGLRVAQIRPGVRENFAYFLASPVLRTVALMLITSQIAVWAIEPIFPLFVQSLGVPQGRVATVAGVLFSVTGSAAILGATLWGRASDRIGERRVLALVLWGSCAAYASQAVVHSPVTLFGVRAVLGLFVGGLMPPLYSIVARLTPPERLGGIMGVTSSAITVGALLGPLLGGMLSAVIGIRPVCLVAAASLAVAALGTRGLAPAGAGGAGLQQDPE